MKTFFHTNSVSVGSCLGIKPKRADEITLWVNNEYIKIIKGEYPDEYISATHFIGNVLQDHKFKTQAEISLVCWLAGVLFGQLEVITNRQLFEQFGRPVD